LEKCGLPNGAALLEHIRVTRTADCIINCWALADAILGGHFSTFRQLTDHSKRRISNGAQIQAHADGKRYGGHEEYPGEDGEENGAYHTAYCLAALLGQGNRYPYALSQHNHQQQDDDEAHAHENGQIEPGVLVLQDVLHLGLQIQTVQRHRRRLLPENVLFHGVVDAHQKTDKYAENGEPEDRSREPAHQSDIDE